MNKFEKQLEKWNGGVLRGAQAKLAKALNVSTATTALWATGKRHPSKGYVAQMAALFETDIYHVLKLFEPKSITYSLPQQTVHTLRDMDNADSYFPILSPSLEEENPYQSNTVQLPFLPAVPTNPNFYNSDEAIEWWNIPRRYALGAKYIISSQTAGFPDAIDKDDLCFIKPCNHLVTNEFMLLKTKENTFVAKKTNKNLKDLIPVGIITRRIRSVK